MAQASAQPRALEGAVPLLLVTLTVTLWAQAVRVLFPLLFNLSERLPESLDITEQASFVVAGVIALALFGVPLLAPAVRRALGRWALPAALGGLVALGLVVQVLRPVPLWAAALATAFALIALTLAFPAARRTGGPVMALGLFLGLTLDSALRSAFRTWDYAWQDGAAPLLLTVVLSAGLLALAWRLSRGSSPPRESGSEAVLPAVAIGPFLFLQLLFLQSVAFAGSATGLPLPAATAVILAADALAVAVVVWVASIPIPRGWALAGGVILVILAFLLTEAAGGAAALVIVAGQGLTAALVTVALAVQAAQRGRSSWRASLGLTLGMLSFVLLAVLYQIHYEVPLPFPNTWIPPAAAAAVTAIAVAQAGGRRSEVRPWQRGLISVPLGLLVVPAALFAARADLATAAPGTEAFRLVNYNVHAGVSTDGQLDPESIARNIEAQNPDVVVLQEVTRGWAIAGTVDLAEWLSHRLEMPYVYQPAADGQFGNAVLSRLPILEAEGAFLPKVEGPQRRSYLRVEVDLGDGRSATVCVTHLQRHDASDTRAIQIETLLEAWGGRPRTVIAGDMNVQPDEEDVDAFFEAGLIDAQDETGNSHLDTVPFPEYQPERGDYPDRVDRIFGSPDLVFSDFRMPFSAASDHLPMAVTVTVP